MTAKPRKPFGGIKPSPIKMKKKGSVLIGEVPQALGTPSHLKRLMAALATFRPKVPVLKEFLRRACLATPAQARSALRRIEDQTETFQSALSSVAGESTDKPSPFQTNGVAPFGKGTHSIKAGKGK